MKLKSYAVLGVLATCLGLLSFGGPANSQAPAERPTVPAERRSNPDDCKGQIMDFEKVAATGNVRLRYRVWCARTQNRIVVSPFLRQGDRMRIPTKECFNDYVCEETARMPDLAGSQWYYARAGFAIDGASENTFVNNGHGDLYCEWDMPCAADGKQF